MVSPLSSFANYIQPVRQGVSDFTDRITKKISPDFFDEALTALKLSQHAPALTSLLALAIVLPNSCAKVPGDGGEDFLNTFLSTVKLNNNNGNNTDPNIPVLSVDAVCYANPSDVAGSAANIVVKNALPASASQTRLDLKAVDISGTIVDPYDYQYYIIRPYTSFSFAIPSNSPNVPFLYTLTGTFQDSSSQSLGPTSNPVNFFVPISLNYRTAALSFSYSPGLTYPSNSAYSGGILLTGTVDGTSNYGLTYSNGGDLNILSINNGSLTINTAGLGSAIIPKGKIPLGCSTFSYNDPRFTDVSTFFIWEVGDTIDVRGRYGDASRGSDARQVCSLNLTAATSETATNDLGTWTPYTNYNVGDGVWILDSSENYVQIICTVAHNSGTGPGPTFGTLDPNWKSSKLFTLETVCRLESVSSTYVSTDTNDLLNAFVRGIAY